jgi:hypothetical protein
VIRGGHRDANNAWHNLATGGMETNLVERSGDSLVEVARSSGGRIEVLDRGAWGRYLGRLDAAGSEVPDALRQLSVLLRGTVIRFATVGSGVDAMDVDSSDNERLKRMYYAAVGGGDPGFEMTPEEQADFDDMKAEVAANPDRTFDFPG